MSILHRDLVEKCLRNIPQDRDSDELLMFHVSAALGVNCGEITAQEFLAKQKRGDLPQMETICRLRRKLQEAIPELRGALYAERQEHAKEVKQNLKRIPFIIIENIPKRHA